MRVSGDRFWAFLGLFIAIVLVSFSAIFTKISEQEIGANATVFDRYSIALLVLILFQGVGTIGQHLKRAVTKEDDRENDREQETFEPPGFEPVWEERYEMRDVYLFVGEGFLSLTCVWLWAISLTQTSVANSNLLHNLTPIFTTLGGIFWLRETIDRRFLGGLGCALLSTLLLQWQDWQLSPEYLWGDCLALLSAVFYAAGFLAREQLRQKFSTSTVLFWNCACRTGFALFLVLGSTNSGFPLNLLPLSRSGWLAVLGLGIMIQIGGHGLLTYSLKHLSASFATLCLLLDPVFTAIFAWGLLGEKLSLVHGITFLGVLLGIYLAATASGADPSRSPLDESEILPSPDPPLQT
jgi:drug/metabolite transporter (DMT)-like permease